MDENGVETRPLIKIYKKFWLKLGIDKWLMILDYVSQPSTFWRTEFIHSIGFFDGEFRNVMDYDYWLRVTRQYQLKFINQYLAKFRIYQTSITSSNSKAQYEDELQVASHYGTLAKMVFQKSRAEISCWLYLNLLNRK